MATRRRDRLQTSAFSDPGEPRAASSLRRRFLLSFGLVAALTLGGLGVLQDLARQQRLDAPSINAAGRQRMLSQRIAKDALRARHAASLESRGHFVALLRETLADWNLGHERLKAELRGPAAILRSAGAGQELARVDTPFRALHDAAREGIEVFEGSATPSPEAAAAALDRILDAEPRYVNEMDRLVALYEAEATARAVYLYRTGLLLALGVVLVLAVTGLFLLEPAARSIQRQFHTRHEVNVSLHEIFGRYVSEDVMHALLDAPKGLELGGEERKVTLLMADLRGFTATADRLEPQQAVRLLNLYLENMTEVVVAHHGTINEFLGDCVFASFGAPLSRPDDALRAAACALSMQLTMERVNRYFEREGLPHLGIGIALHTGSVVAGSIGCLKRAKYGVVGAAVNFTSRLEGCALAGQVLVSESTLGELGADAEASTHSRFMVKGVGGPMHAYELTGLKEGPRITPVTGAGKLFPLSDGLPVCYRRIADNQVLEPEFHGEIRELSSSQAAIVCTGAESSSLPAPAVQDEIELFLLPPEGSLDPGQAWRGPTQEPIYARVVQGWGPYLHIWFSAVPTGAHALLENRVRGVSSPARQAGEAAEKSTPNFS